MNLKEAMELKVQRVQGIKDVVYSRIKENVLTNGSNIKIELAGADVSSLCMVVDGYQIGSKVDKAELINILDELLDGEYILKAVIEDREYDGDGVRNAISNLGSGCYRKIIITVSGWKE